MKNQERKSSGRFSTKSLGKTVVQTEPLVNRKIESFDKANPVNSIETNEIIVISVKKLTEIITNIIQVELKKHQETSSQVSPEDEFLNATETIAFLRVSRPTYQKLRHEGQLPAVMASEKRLLFKKSDLIAYLNNRKEKA